MTKADLVDKVYIEFECTKSEASDIVEEVLDLMKATLQQGEKVKVQGFGQFKVKEKAARRGRNPQTGDAIMIEGRCIIHSVRALSLKRQ